MGVQVGRLCVRRSAFIGGTAERVWQEFTSIEAFTAWFGTGHTVATYEPRLGGRVWIDVEGEGGRWSFGGPILVFEPGRELSFENNLAPPHAWPVPLCTTFRITPLYGGTLVEILIHGIERLGSGAADLLEGLEGGWDNHHLVALRSIVEA